MNDQIDENWKAPRRFEPSAGFDFSAIAPDEQKEAFADAIVCHAGTLEDALHDVGRDFLARYGGSVVTRFLSFVCNARNPRLTCRVMSYVASLTDCTLEQIAADEGVKKQAVFQMAKKIQEELGLPPTPAQRSAEARASMSDSYQKRKIEKNRK